MVILQTDIIFKLWGKIMTTFKFCFCVLFIENVLLLTCLFCRKNKIDILTQSKKVLIISVGQNLLGNSTIGLTEFTIEFEITF